MSISNLIQVSKASPCKHCGKDRYCYRYSDSELEVCKGELCGKTCVPAPGWIDTKNRDSEGGIILAPTKKSREMPKAQIRYWEYSDRAGNPLVRVERRDDGLGGRKFAQQRWDGRQWIYGLGKITRKEVPIYRYPEIRAAIQSEQPIFIVEGEKCAEALWTKGIAATCNLGGAGKWQPSDSLDLKGAKLVLCPDRDAPGIKHLDSILKDFPDAQIFLPFPESKLWGNLPPKYGHDIADYLEDFPNIGLEEILAGIMNTETFRSKLENLIQKQEKGEKLSARNSRKIKHYQIIKEGWGERLRLNELKNIIELDGKPLRLDWLPLLIAMEFDIDTEKEESIGICSLLAEANKYNPVKDYLEKCYANYQEKQEIDINNLATRWLGTEEALANIYLKRYLIGAVARIYEPGCKLDTSLILQGEQGLRKSTFFRVLHQGEGTPSPQQQWFDDTMRGVDNRDELDKVHRFWCLEWGEIRRLLRKGDDEIKGFLASQSDTYRPPYGREPITKSRQSVIVGSCNPQEFLSDESGDRRFWVIACKKHINIEALIEERDEVWGAAVAAYKAGEGWVLSHAEQQLSTLQNREHHTSDSWEEYVIPYLLDRESTTLGQIFLNALEMPKERQDRKAQFRLASILVRLGWEKSMIQFQGHRLRGWILKKNTPQGDDPTDPTDPTPPFELDHPPNAYGISDLGHPDPTDPTIPIKLSTGNRNSTTAEREGESAGKVLKYSELDQLDQAASESFASKGSNPDPTLDPTPPSVGSVGSVGSENAGIVSQSVTKEDIELVRLALAECSSASDLSLLRECWSSDLLNLGAKKLAPGQHAQIKQWAIELKNILQVGDKVFVESLPHTDSMGPYSIESIEGNLVKVEGFAKMINLSNLRRAE